MSTTYIAPNISAAGLSLPTYQQILAKKIANFQAVFGTTYYLGADSPMYQFLANDALDEADVMAAIQLAYNSRSPVSAVGAALDSLGKLMGGIARKVASYSTCPVTCTGTAGAVITNGVAQDASGIQWSLPASVTIGSGGSVTISATCQQLGAIAVGNNSITTMVNPQAGWTGITNGTNAAVLGQPVETDAQYRARLFISQALPSLTQFSGTVAAIASLSGVTRQQCYENPTGTTSDGTTIFGTPAGKPLPSGLPAHSVTCVVEGGTNLAVATAIYANKGIGCYTNGTTSQSVTDPNNGVTAVINFYQPTYQTIYVSLSVHLLPGGTSATLTAVQAAIIAYLQSLQIGQAITLSALYAAGMSVTPNLSMPIFSIEALTLGTSASPSGTSDITLAFNYAAQATTSSVIVSSV